jgi:hypothetical protein
MHESLGIFFNELLSCEPVSILDLGAQFDGEVPLYALVSSFVPCEILGIDVAENMSQDFLSQFQHPNVAEFRRAFLGSGEEHLFYSCSRATTSSFFMPNHVECQKYEGLSEPLNITDRQLVATIRLDDIVQDRVFHMIKSDLQGSDLDVLSFGTSVLARSLMVVIEVEFIEQYAGGPRFCEVQRFMEGNGFIFHSFHDFGTRPLAGFDPEWPGSGRGFKQWLWANAIFVRKPDMWEGLSNQMISIMAVLSHLQLKAFDYSWNLLRIIDRRNGTQKATHYVELLRA